MTLETTSSSMPNSEPSKLLLTVAIGLACVLAWSGYSFPPKTWRIPDDMSNIGALSPKADQDRLAVTVNSNLWSNTLLKFSLAGLGLGTAGLIFAIRNFRKHGVMAVVTLLSGLAGGAAAGSIGLIVRKFLDLEYPLPFVSDASRPLVCDSAVFVIISTLLLIPIFVLLFFHGTGKDRNRAFSIPLAGMFTGLLVAFLGATILPSATNTSFYPPAGHDLTLVWFGTLALVTLVLCVFRGSKQTAGSEAKRHNEVYLGDKAS